MFMQHTRVAAVTRRAGRGVQVTYQAVENVDGRLGKGVRRGPNIMGSSLVMLVLCLQLLPQVYHKAVRVMPSWVVTRAATNLALKSFKRIKSRIALPAETDE